jgi:hypothetical protein
MLVCINIYPKSVLRYKYLILGTYHLDTLYLVEHECECSWFFFEAEMSLRPTKFRNSSLKLLQDSSYCGLYRWQPTLVV